MTINQVVIHCIKSNFMQVRFRTEQIIFVIDCHKSLNFKIMFLGNSLVLITTFRNMVVKFIGGCFVATRSYVIIHSVSKITVLPVVCGTIITKVFVLEAASFVLSHNNFQFDSYIFLQLVCTAMGTKFAPHVLVLDV